MALGCGLTMCKYVLFFFNFIIFLSGATILGVGIWLAIDKSSVIQLLKATNTAVDDPNMTNINNPAILETIAYILIAAGAVIFILGFLGCCGALHESKTMLASYASLLVIFLCLELGAGIYAYIARNDFKEDFLKIAITSLKHYKDESGGDALSLSWNYVFAELKCCGVYSHEDMKSTEWWTAKQNSQLIPKSCCHLKGNPAEFIPSSSTCPSAPSDFNANLGKGCYDEVIKWMDNHMRIVIGVAIGLALTQMLAVLFACCLCCTISPKD